ncbi:Uncharacterised protein [Mycobacteroides abscessus]|nr:Uncharacterised protein [Mycobacteroides abscessus]
MRAGWPDSAGKHRPSGTPPSSQGAGSDGGTSSTANSVPRSCFAHERCTRSTTSSTTSSNFSARVRLAGAVGGRRGPRMPRPRRSRRRGTGPWPPGPGARGGMTSSSNETGGGVTALRRDQRSRARRPAPAGSGREPGDDELPRTPRL